MSEETELHRAVTRLTGSIERLEETLVRKDVYVVSERARDAELTALREDLGEIKDRATTIEDKRAADRRLLLTSLALPVLLIIIQLYLATQLGGGPPT